MRAYGHKDTLVTNFLDEGTTPSITSSHFWYDHGMDVFATGEISGIGLLGYLFMFGIRKLGS